MNHCCSLLKPLFRTNIRLVRSFRTIGYLNGAVLFKSEGTEKWSTKTTQTSRPSVARNVQRLMEVPEERKITVKLLDENGKMLGIMRKSEARNLAFNKELVLVDLPLQDNTDSAVNVESDVRTDDQQVEHVYAEVCQLQTKAKADRLKREEREQRKVERLTQEGGESEVKITTEMGKKHFESKLKQIDKWLDKRRVVKLHLVLNKNSTKVELDAMKEKILSHVSDRAAITKEKYSTSSIYMEFSPVSHASPPHHEASNKEH